MTGGSRGDRPAATDVVPNAPLGSSRGESIRAGVMTVAHQSAARKFLAAEPGRALTDARHDGRERAVTNQACWWADG